MRRSKEALAIVLVALGAAAAPAGAATIPGNIVQVDSSHDHTLARTADGKVLAWGRNYFGSLGDGTTVDRAAPVEVQGLPAGDPIKDVSAGWSRSVALTQSGRVFAWGKGSTGDGTRTDRRTAVEIHSWQTAGASPTVQGDLPAIADVEANGSTFAISTTGDVYGWGTNTAGQLGIGVNGHTHITTGYDRVRPTKMNVVTNVAEVSSGSAHTLVRTQSGAVYGMGDGYLGQIGDGQSGANARTTDPVLLSFAALPGGTTITQVEAGGDASYALTSAGRVYSWGSGIFGALALGESWKGDKTTPSLVPTSSLQNVTELVAGEDVAFAKRTDGSVWGWGSAYFGEHGDGRQEDERYSGVPLPHLAGAKQLAAGRNHAFVLDATDTLRGFGGTEYGQVGNGQVRYVPGAAAVPGVAGATQIAAGTDVSFARLADGTLMAWGSNRSGLLGNGTTTDRAAARPVVGLTNVAGVSTGLPNMDEYLHFYPDTTTYRDTERQQHVLTFDASGRVWAWGRNRLGQVGDGTTTDRLRPTLVRVPGKVVAVAAGGTHSLALNDAGEVYGWGYNEYGQAGGTPTGDLQFQTTPRKVEGLPPVTQIVAGTLGSAARTAAGAVYAWGRNNLGWLGNGSNTTPAFSATPVLVPFPAGLPAATSLTAGGRHLLVTTGSSGVWGWGANIKGSINTSQSGRHLTPIRVTEVDASTFTALAGGDAHSLGVTSTGDVVAWGENTAGAVGQGAPEMSPPVDVPLPVDARAVAGGFAHSLVLGTDGKVYGWGFAGAGALGYAVPELVPTPASDGTPPPVPDEPADIAPIVDPDAPVVVPPGQSPTPPGVPAPLPPGGGAPRGPGPVPSTSDRTPPALTLAQPACAKKLSAAKCRALRRTAKAWRTLTGTATDAGGVARVEVAVFAKLGKRWYAVSGGRVATVKDRTAAEKLVTRGTTTGTRWSAKLPALRAGSWTVRIRAIDRAGNASAWKQATVRIARR